MKVNPPEMSSKIRPKGFPCFLHSSISSSRRRAGETVLEASMIRLPWRPTGRIPACARPCPFEREKPATGERDIRKFRRTPFSTTVTRLARTPSSSAAKVPLRSTPARVAAAKKARRVLAPFQNSRFYPFFAKMQQVIASGVLPTTPMPSFANRCASSGVCNALEMLSYTRCTIGRGRPAGAPYASQAGRPTKQSQKKRQRNQRKMF